MRPTKPNEEDEALAKPNYAFEKRKREMEQKRKKEEKLQRKQQAKLAKDGEPGAEAPAAPEEGPATA